MNDMTVRQSGAVAAPQKNFFEQLADAANGNRIVGDLLKFSKGEYLAGQNGDEVEVGTKLVANMATFSTGWVRWADNRPTESVMGKVMDGFVPPRRSELGDNDRDAWEIDQGNGQPRDPWQFTNQIIFKDADGDKLYTFATSSKGGLGALAKLAGAYGTHVRLKPNEMPVIALEVESYRHSNKAYGKIFTPQFDVVGWVNRKAIDEAMEAEAGSAEDGDDTPFDEEDVGNAHVISEPVSKEGGRAKAAAAPESEF